MKTNVLGKPAALLCHWLLHFLTLLLARHWMIGLVNLVLTAVLGLGLVEAAARWHFLALRPHLFLWLRRALLLAALFKGALYLVLGESMHAPARDRWIVGIQFPDPMEVAGLIAQTRDSIWHPTAISQWVSLTLGSLATAYLVRRAAQLLLTRRRLDTLVRFGQGQPAARASQLLWRAAEVMGISPGAVPLLVQIEMPHWGRGISHTPMLLGVRRPLLLLPPLLLDALSDAEMEMVFRHELAHLLRRDHWWRWFLLWITDVGWPTLLASTLKGIVIEIEEQLCDRIAVRTPQDALNMAAALGKALALVSKPDRTSGGASNTALAAVPLLLGGYAASWQRPASLRERIAALLTWSHELSAGAIKGAPIAISPVMENTDVHNLVALRRQAELCVRAICRFLLGLLLLLIVYAKFHLTLNLQ